MIIGDYIRYIQIKWAMRKVGFTRVGEYQARDIDGEWEYGNYTYFRFIDGGQ